MAKSKKREQEDAKARSLKCFENQPNINMVIPWIYEICKSMSDSSDNSEDEVAKSLKCFENQPNINMVIPWIYQIYKSVKSGNSGQGQESGNQGGSGQQGEQGQTNPDPNPEEDDGWEWEDLT